MASLDSPDTNDTAGAESEPPDETRAVPPAGADLIYESNPKHSEPWQSGRKGSLCEREVRPHAQRLLERSELVGNKRYAVFDGKAYCANEHSAGHWHGYPVGWVEVPAVLVLRWIRERRITKRDKKRYWESH